MSDALSLVCGDCGRQLKSAAQAKEHAEESGHVNFSESTEAILKVVCQECGKACRTQTEKDLHTQRTGHSTFVDKTTENSKPVSYDDNPPTSTSRSVQSDAMDVEPKPKKLVKPKVDEELLASLLSLEFNENRAIRAIYSSGAKTIEDVLSWLEQHQADINLDSEFLVEETDGGSSEATNAELQHLSPEEAHKRALELQAKARQLREQKEKEAEKEREKARIRAAQEMAQARKDAEEVERKLIIEQKRREKFEDEQAKKKIKDQLERDKAERMAKFGGQLSNQPKQVEKVPPQVKSFLRTITGANPSEVGASALKIIIIYFKNIIENPNEEKFKKILKTNKAFQTRIIPCKGALDLLKFCGFQEKEDCFVFDFPQHPQDDPSVVLQPVDQLRFINEEVTKASNNPFYK